MLWIIGELNACCSGVWRLASADWDSQKMETWLAAQPSCADGFSATYGRDSGQRLRGYKVT